MHPITYIFLLGKREEIWNPLVPFSELTNRYLLSLGEYPQCLEHFATGVDYFTALYRSGLHLSYMALFVYEDTVDDIRLDHFCLQDEVAIFFLCTDDKDCRKHIDEELRKTQKDHYAYVCPEGSGFMDGCKNVFHSREEVFSFLYDITPRYIDTSRFDSPFTVPVALSDADRGLHFLPTRTNSRTLHHIFGNWLML